MTAVVQPKNQHQSQLRIQVSAFFTCLQELFAVLCFLRIHTSGGKRTTSTRSGDSIAQRPLPMYGASALQRGKSTHDVLPSFRHYPLTE